MRRNALSFIQQTKRGSIASVASGISSKAHVATLEAVSSRSRQQASSCSRTFATSSCALNLNPSRSKPPRQGQPLSSTHPHLINSKHLTPGIPAEEYEARRKKLMESLPDGSVVICMGGTVKLVTQRKLYLLGRSTPRFSADAYFSEIL